MSTKALLAHLAEFHGVISRAEARKIGLSPSQISGRLCRGEWVLVGPSVYRFAGTAPTWRGRARAAALSVNGLVSHRAAAGLWGIDGFEHRLIEVSIGRDRRVERAGVKVHQSTQMDRAQATVVDGVPVTGLARTVLDVAGVVGRKRLDQTVDAVLRQGLLEWPDLYQVMVRHSRRGRNGTGRLRALLDERFGETAIPDSKWNRMFSQLLEDVGLPKPALEHEIVADRVVARVDLAYPRQRVAIELDSVQHHFNRQSFEADPRRKNALTLLGWQVLTFTWADYNDHPEAVVRTIRTALESNPPPATPQIARFQRA